VISLNNASALLALTGTINW